MTATGDHSLESKIYEFVAGGVELFSLLSKANNDRIFQAIESSGRRLVVTRGGTLRVLHGLLDRTITAPAAQAWASFVRWGVVAGGVNAARPLGIEFEEAHEDLIIEIVARLDEIGDVVDGGVTDEEIEGWIEELGDEQLVSHEVAATPTPELRLFDAIVRAVMAVNREWSIRVIDAAVNALVDGLDSPSLRVLAGQPATDELINERLLVATCAELGVPYPSRRERWTPQEIDGKVWTRIPRDSIRFAVVPAEAGYADFEIRMFVNEVDVTKGMGMGLDPIDTFWRTNDLVALPGTRAVPFARCSSCGEVGCDPTWVVVTRDATSVHWDWEQKTHGSPDVGVSFPAEIYDAEVERIRADRSCERPQDVVTRLVFEGVDREGLRKNGLRLNWATQDYKDASRISVSLSSPASSGEAEHPFQVFLLFPWNQVDAEPVSAEILRLLSLPPKKWRATFKTNRSTDTRYVPPIASWRWKRRDY